MTTGVDRYVDVGRSSIVHLQCHQILQRREQNVCRLPGITFRTVLHLCTFITFAVMIIMMTTMMTATMVVIMNEVVMRVFKLAVMVM